MSQPSPHDRAAEIRKTMDSIRGQLDKDLGKVQTSARTLLDWHFYIRNYPWACLGGAALIGYLVVPRKLEIQAPDVEALEKLARRHHLVVEQRPKAEEKSGFVAGAFGFLTTLVLRTAMMHLGNRLGEIFESGPLSGSSSQTTPPAARDMETARPRRRH